MNEAISKVFIDDSYAKKLGINILDWKKGYAKTEVTIGKDMLNFHKAANGGLIFSLADYAFAIASNSYGQMAVGINTSMSYIKAAAAGESLICRATEISNNGRLAIYNMEIKNEQKELIATMEGMVYRKREFFVEEG